MYSLLEAAGKGSPTTPARDRSSVVGPPPARFDRTGGNSITAGCFLGAAAAAAATPSTGPPPVTLTTPGTLEVPVGKRNAELFGVRQRHPLLAVDGISRKRAHAGVSQKTVRRKNAKGPEQPGQTSRNTSITAVGLDKQQRSQRQGVIQTRKPTDSFETPSAMKIVPDTGNADSEGSADVDMVGTHGGGAEFSNAHPSDDENNQGQYITGVASSSFHEEPRPDGRAAVVVSHDRKEDGMAEEPTDPELLQDSPTIENDRIKESFSNSPTSIRPLQPSQDAFHTFHIPEPKSFLMSTESPEDNTATVSASVQQEAQSSCNGGASTREEQQSTQQHHQQQQQQGLRKGAHHKPVDQNGKKRVGKTKAQATGGKLLSSQRLDGIMAAYSNNNLVPPILPASGAATKKETKAAKKNGAKPTVGGGGAGRSKQARSSTRVGAGSSEDVSGGGGTTRWRQGASNSAAVTAAAKAAERMRKLETLMNAAMESPVTYEEQVRRERLAHLRVMYTVERDMAELPVDFLRGVGYEDYGIKPRLSRMCAALGKSHRWSKAVALSRWARALEKARADEFAEEMLRYEHARLFATLSSIRKRWELKQARRRFLGWRKRARLARLAEDQDRARVGAIKIQRWARRRLAARRRRRALEQRERRRNALARDKADAVAGVLSFEDNRRETLWRTLRLVDEKRRYEANHRAATALQDAWLRHVGRCQLLEYAEMERQELHRRRLAEQARRWAAILPLARGFLSACLDRSQRAVIAKLRARHETLRLAYEAELAEHRRVLNAAHAVIAHAWRGKRSRLEFLARMNALVNVQRAWKRSAGRRRLQAEIDARVVATTQRIKKARESAASRLQAFARKSAQRHQLSKRFATRKAKLDFERRNRSELASACLVMFKPSRAIREAAGREDYEAMGDAVRPAEVVARLRANAAARGVSLSQIMSGAFDDGDGDDEGGVGEDGVPKRLSGSELARAVLKQQENQRRAAEAVQLAWRKRKALLHLEGLFAKRKVKILNDRRELSALRLQRVWASARLRAELAARVEATRVRIAAERDWAARKLQRLCRRRKDAKELASRFAIRKIILEQARSLREMNAAVSRIQLWYLRRQGVYYTTLRIVARYQLTYKRDVLAREEYLRRREEAAVAVQLAWRRRSMRVYLSRRFEGRRARIALAKQAAERDAAAKVLQGWWRRRQARAMLRGRFAKRARLMVKKAEEEEQARLEDDAARLLQRTWTRHCEWEKMRLRFRLRRKVLDETFALEESKRLELEHLEHEKREEEKRLHREHEATKVKLLLEEAERKRKADEAADHLLKAWKLGWDQDNARNYWFNHVTGESSLERPEGWVILPSERWKKQTNDKGLAYYLDLETGESHWFPPCEQCYKREGEKICMDCEGQVYCGRCWTIAHKEEHMAGHVWKGADSGKEDLSPGERHCVDCGFRKAKWVCLQCKDALCGECNARIHGSGHRKNHQVETYAKSKKGWQTVEGRTDNEPTYYFNASTGESTFDKPQDLMLPEELVEHLRFLKYKETSEKYVQKIEKLQFQLEELMYEKDKIAYQWANAQKDMNADHGTGGGLSLSGLKFGGGDKKSKKKAAGEDPRTREQEEGYKKSLLLSRKDKKDMGFEVKLKKETVLDS